MKKLNKFFLMLFASSLFLASCSSDDNSPNVSLGQYDNGVFVVNEGNSTITTSSITFISNSGAVEQDVFRNVNRPIKLRLLTVIRLNILQLSVPTCKILDLEL